MDFLQFSLRQTKAINSALAKLTDEDVEIQVSNDLNQILIKNIENTSHFLLVEYGNKVFNVADHSLPDVFKFIEPSTVYDYLKQFKNVRCFFFT